MTKQTETTARDLSLEDLDRVSGAGTKVPQSGRRGDPGTGGDASVAYPPGPSAGARELGPEDLDRVSGAGLGIPQHPDVHCRKAGGGMDPQGGGEAALQFEPNGPSRGIIAI